MRGVDAKRFLFALCLLLSACAPIRVPCQFAPLWDPPELPLVSGGPCGDGMALCLDGDSREKLLQGIRDLETDNSQVRRLYEEQAFACGERVNQEARNP